MAVFTSLMHEKFRKNFFVFLFLSSIFPLLLLIFIIYQYVIPVIMPDQINGLKGIFTYGVLVMLLPSFLSFALGSKWIGSIETISEDIKSKSVQIIGEKEEFTVENEFENIQQNFNVLHDEFQSKINELNEVSKKLIDSNSKFKKLALTDELTSLYNRRSFDLRLIEETSRADRYKQKLSLIMIDLDDFKRHNDTYGHQTGDKLLEELADMIRKSIRESDSAFRFGGDEFAVLLPVCDIKNAEHIAQKLVEKVSTHQFKNVEGHRIDKVTISCGVACYKEKLEAFVAEADKHLFAAKASGKGLIVTQK
ncbi:MAG: GGDEF domain-containing protein [Desulfobacteraceae bacterium]|nr:GGDEF domain-containing protein [Desulfobacteraceae bacterium]